MKFLDLIGKKFGRLVVLKRSSNSKWGDTRFLCKCDCGENTIVNAGRLKRKTTKSCGCLRNELTGLRAHFLKGKKSPSFKHGEAIEYKIKKKCTKEYACWVQMNQRCYDKNHPHYKDYGGRGISVCNRWRTSYLNFLKDMGRTPSSKHSIDRKNNDGNYVKSNCRWATSIEQNRNTRRN